MLNIILLFDYCRNLSPQLMHVCDNSKTDTSLITCARSEIYLLILLLTPLLGKTPIVFYGQNTTVGVLPYATGRFDPYVLCNTSFIISYV